MEGAQTDILLLLLLLVLLLLLLLLLLLFLEIANCIVCILFKIHQIFSLVRD